MYGPKENGTVLEFGYEQELKRTLSFWDLLIYGLIYMVPIAPFGIYGYVVQSSGGMVSLAYFIGMIGMIFTALSYAHLSRAFPISGSVYSYAQRGINEHIGFFAGWLILLDYMLIPALLYLVSATALYKIAPQIPIFIWIMLFLVINTTINILGIDITAKTNRIIVFLEMLILLIFMGAALLAACQHKNGIVFSFRPLYNPDNFHISRLMSAASIAVLSFLGFDAISTLSEEARGNTTVVGRAIISSLMVVGFLFIVQTWVAALIIPDYSSFASLEGAFYEIAERAGGTFLKLLTVIATALAWGIANTLVAQAAISRILYSMARDKKLPSILASVHPRYKTPYASTLLVAFISLFITVFLETKIDELATLVNFGALSSFLILHFTVIKYFIFKKGSQDYLNHLILPAIGFFVIAYVWSSLNPLARKLGFIWICIGILYMVALKLLHKDSFLSEDLP